VTERSTTSISPIDSSARTAAGLTVVDHRHACTRSHGSLAAFYEQLFGFAVATSTSRDARRGC
jgi:hypothetical protein